MKSSKGADGRELPSASSPLVGDITSGSHQADSVGAFSNTVDEDEGDLALGVDEDALDRDDLDTDTVATSA